MRLLNLVRRAPGPALAPSGRLTQRIGPAAAPAGQLQENVA